MTNENDPMVALQDSVSENEGRSSRISCATIRVWLFVLVFVMALFAGLMANRAYPELFGGSKTDKATRSVFAGAVLNGEGAALRSSQVELEARVAALETRVASLASSSAPVQQDQTVNDRLAAMGSALDALEAKQGQSAASAQSVQSDGREALAMTLSYVRLYVAALSGQAFAGEMMKVQSAFAPMFLSDPAASAAAVTLEPFSAQGVSGVDALRREWPTLSLMAQSAARQAIAQTWGERLLAAVQGLISVRTVGGASGSTTPATPFDAVEAALARGQAVGALAAMAALPAEATPVLKEWRGRLEARVKVEEALAKLGDALAARLAQPSAANLVSDAVPSPLPLAVPTAAAPTPEEVPPVGGGSVTP